MSEAVWSPRLEESTRWEQGQRRAEKASHQGKYS